MKKLKVVGSIAKKIAKGVFDAVLPNVSNSIKPVQSEFENEPDKLNIDWLRLATAIITFACMVLFAMDVIDYEKVMQILELWKLV